MTIMPTNSALRSARGPGEPLTDSLKSTIHAAVAATPQQRRAIAWPWTLAASATEPERRRVVALRFAVVTLAVVASLVAAAIAGAALVRKPILAGPITFMRNGQALTVDPASHEVVPVAAFAGRKVLAILVAPTGQLLVTFGDPGRTRGLRLQLFSAHGEAGALLQPPEPAVLTGDSTAFSPDGTTILAGISVAGSHHLAFFDPATGLGQIIGPDDLEADRASWSEDGKQIAFRAPVRGTNARGMYALDVATGTARLVVAPLPDDVGVWQGATWAQDGRTLLVGAARAENGEPVGIWSVDLADGSIRRLTPPGFEALAPAFSPDGSWVELARFVRLSDLQCTADLFVMRPDGSQLQMLLANAWPAGWSPDGQWLMAESAVQLGAAGELAHGPAIAPFGGILLVRPDGTDLSVVTAYTAADAANRPAHGDGCAWSYGPGWQAVP
jgi:hypothetical protein